MEYQVRASVAGLDAFIQGYLECAEWSGIHDEQSEAFELSIRPEWSAQSKASAREDCEAFQRDNAEALTVYYRERSESDAGHDFWLTRNHHGAGFWDGRVSDSDVAKSLTDASHPYGDAIVWFDEQTERLHLKG